MELSEIIPHIEALIFASEKPLTSLEVVELVNNAFGFMEERITLDQVESAMEGIREKYNSEFYPFEVKESGGGWQFLTKKSFHKTIAQLNGEKFLKRLSTAALETLAIIAYKQPITKGEIEAIRGVNSDYSVQKLLEKELIVISGRNEKLPGHPLVYSTSKTFMDYFGINSAEDLPKIREVFADQLVEPTVIRHSESETPEFLQGDSSEEFPEPHMETPVESQDQQATDESPSQEESQLTINEEGQLIIKDDEDLNENEDTGKE
jgi:segregation and condensation protein B